MAGVVLVPFDGRPAAVEALEAACAAARLDASTIVALYVARIPRQLPLTARLPWLAAEATAIQQHAEKLGRDAGVTVWAEWVAAREVAQTIVDVAAEIRADHILMGMRRRRLSTWLLPWSTPAQVVNLARCPVVVRALPLGARPAAIAPRVAY